MLLKKQNIMKTQKTQIPQIFQNSPEFLSLLEQAAQKINRHDPKVHQLLLGYVLAGMKIGIKEI